MFQSWEGIKNSKNNGRNMNVVGFSSIKGRGVSKIGISRTRVED
jgi:hypothetical protein